MRAISTRFGRRERTGESEHADRIRRWSRTVEKRWRRLRALENDKLRDNLPDAIGEVQSIDEHAGADPRRHGLPRCVTRRCGSTSRCEERDR